MRYSRVDGLYKEILMTEPEDIARAVKRLDVILHEYSLATRLMMLSTLLLCYTERNELTTVNILGLGDAMLHQGDYNNVSKEFKGIYEMAKEEVMKGELNG